MGFRDAFSRNITRLNLAVADSRVGVWFKLDDGRSLDRRTGAVFTTELRAGLTTFAAMAYIISVNASIISATGGTCACDSTPDDPICLKNAAYATCKEIVRRDLITSTAAASCIASFLMGAFANLPVGLAPGLCLNAYFTYSVVGINGTGRITYPEALAAVFLEGWIFFFMSIFGIRMWLARLIPRSLILAVGAGIGLFIALIGLSHNGLGVVGGDYTNLVGLGGCQLEYADPDHPAFCLSHVLQSPRMWIGICLGGIVTVIMMMYRIRGAIILGIFMVSIVSWPRQSAVTLFPYTAEGDSAFDNFKQIVGFYPLRKIGNAADYNYFNGRVWSALITFLYVDLFDTTGTLYTMAKHSGLVDPITKDFERSTVAYCVDAISISIGSLLGISPVTAFIESAAGISDGGKTGLTAISISFWFFVSIFFSPVFAAIPSYATGGALIICGCLMIRNVAEINWRYIGDAIPAFLTLIIIPFTYNIAYGLIGGILSFAIINGFAWLLDVLTGGRTVPPGYYTDREEWSMPQGGLIPFWVRKLIRGDRRFWVNDAEPGHMSHLQQERALALQMCAQHTQMVENPHARKFRHSMMTASVTGDEGDLEAFGGGIVMPMEAVLDVMNARRDDADETGSEYDRMSTRAKRTSSLSVLQRQLTRASLPPHSPPPRRDVDVTKRRSAIEVSAASRLSVIGTMPRVPSEARERENHR